MEYISGPFKEEFDRTVELKLKSAKVDFFYVKRKKPTEIELTALITEFKGEAVDKFEKLAWKAEKATEQFEEEHFKVRNI
jgi:hypothetical protein